MTAKQNYAEKRPIEFSKSIYNNAMLLGSFKIMLSHALQFSATELIIHILLKEFKAD